MTDDVPNGLHDLEYARGLIENVLAWPPAKTNLELIGDCLGSLRKAKGLSGPQAYRYLRRSVTLAKQQGIPIDRFFFLEGRYSEVRPEKPNGLPSYTPIDREALAREQATPEWQQENAQLRAMLAKWAGRTAMP